MGTQDWLNFFKKHNNIKVFYTNHLKLFTNMNNHSLSVSLSRLNNKKTVKRICRGFYANPFNTPTLEEISNQIYQPSYVSLESALHSWGILSQIPYVLTCVTTHLPRTFNTSFGSIEYRQIKKGFFWGFLNRQNYFIAEPEKALLDYLYLRKDRYVGLDSSDLDFSEINHKKLKFYAKKMEIEPRLNKLLT